MGNIYRDMNIRSTIFWAKDAISGGIISKFSAEVKSYLYSQKYVENERQLKHILDYCSQNVEFYKPYSAYKSIADFPVINKITIRENEASFLAPGYDKEKLFKEETSGSTGTPLVIYQDGVKRRRARADTIVFSEYAGYGFGTRLYYSRVWNAYNRKSALQARIQNIVMQDSDKLSDADLEDFLTRLEKDSSKKSVLIFASSLVALYQYALRRASKPKAKIESFITMSESLPESVRKGVSELFNTVVVSRYSDCECGIIAQQCPHSNEYHVNTGSFYVEILDFDSDKPVKEGEMGRIVVTDLFNHAMPLVRYDTGDVGIFAIKSECGKGSKVLTRVDGRRIDCFYSTKGEMLSPYVINNTMWRFSELRQYQFIQNGENDYVLKLNAQQDAVVREKELLDAIKEYVGIDANIHLEYVDEIPLLASGKRKQVICNYKI